MANIQKIAITGANGYLGTNTIKAAIKRGWLVNAIIRRDELIGEIKVLGATPFVIENFNVEQLKNAFNGCQAIIHFANTVCGTKEQFQKVNVDGLKNLLIAAEKGGISRIIYPSGLGISKIDLEDWATNNYFFSKKKAEDLLIQGSTPYVIFRPSYILGPGDELIPDLIEQIYDGTIFVVGDGKVPSQPIFIEDAVAAFLNASEGIGENNRIYELVGMETTNMNQLIERILEQIKAIGLNIPKPDIKFISYENAPQKLGLCPEMVDVMRCNITTDGIVTSKALNFTLHPLNKAIEAAVKAKLAPEIKNSEKRAILMLSGGIDSATSLYWAINEGYEIIALSLNYKWRPEKEKEAAKKLAEMMKIKLIELSIPYVMGATDLRLEGYPIPSATNAPEGYIPLKNLMFYSTAAYFAEMYGATTIIGGHIQEDFQKFPDSRPSFFKNLEEVIANSKHDKDFHKISFFFPFSKKTKREIINLAHKLHVPISITWSCYGDFQEPCGKCNSCLKRQEAIDSYK